MATEEQGNSRPWLYQKGQSGNPGGRPKGSKTLKTYLKERFERMNDEEREEFLEGIDKKVLWEMAEGKAKQDIDLGGEITKKVINLHGPGSGGS